MKRTKIVCTMGPKTENVELLKEMIKSGMNVARFNFSHGSHEEHAGRMALVEEARKAVNIPVATMIRRDQKFVLEAYQGIRRLHL